MLSRRLIRCFSCRSFNHRFSTSSKEPFQANSIIDECVKLRESVQILNDKVHGPLEKTTQKNTILPFVFLLGNHSSGKSSFINYLLQRKVQTTGVAPTDDSFSIIIPGDSDLDRDGPALIGDPDMGFSGLRSFGPTLMHHTQLKVRSDTAIKDLMIVDSPGMIDSPAVKSAAAGGSVSKSSLMDRGYDFEGVVKWFATRADVVLLFFDPDKPGTTGETLFVLTNALVGMEHKLHIILNKADQFRKIHDFARAYGSLCWNLSKVILRKDLPRIYTMCLPEDYRTRAPDRERGGETEALSLGQGLLDLQTSREDVVMEVMNAPSRRVDNEITRLGDSVQLLQMHCNILGEIVSAYRAQVWRSRAVVASSVVVVAAASAGAVTLGLPLEFVGAGGFASSFVVLGMYALQARALTNEAKRLVQPENFSAVFQRLYHRGGVSERDEFTTSLWVRVQEHLTHVLSFQKLEKLVKLRATELQELEKIIETDVPNLRRKVAPLLRSLSTRPS